MKEMLKEDFIRLFIFVVLSILSVVYVGFIDKNESLAVITKSFIYIVPILTYLKNRDYLKTYGVKKTLTKEAIILISCLIAYFGVEMLTSYIFTKELYHISYIVDIFVLMTEFIVLSIMLFIGRFYRKVSFVLFLVIITVMFVLISRAKEYSFIIYIFYTIIDIALSLELLGLAKHYQIQEEKTDRDE